MLKNTRRLLAVVSLLLMFAVFVDFTGTAARWLSFLPKLQLIPALFALNALALAVIVVLTLLLGRIYCSIICPLGIIQDIAARVRKWLSPKRKRKGGLYGYKPAHKALRYSFLGVFVLLAAAGLTGLFAASYSGLLDPYSIFGRATGQWLVPAWRQASVFVAQKAAESQYYIIDGFPAPSAFSWLLAGIAAAQIIIVIALAVWKGRIYCNAVCPVGTALGAVSRHSLMRIVIDEDKCVVCGKCARHCKSECIDFKGHNIDYSRCVVCMDCLDKCSTNALSFRMAPRKHKAAAKPDQGRRAFLAGAGVIAGAMAAHAADKVTDGGLAPIKKKESHTDVLAPVPAGAVSVKHLQSHCTACQLCISACPQAVLKPSLKPGNFMQPEMHFTEGFCDITCNRCSEVCPAGAIKPIDIPEKTSIKVGSATVDPFACISAAFGQQCGTCARNCPTGAIEMVRGENGNLRPVVGENACIGCGKCEFVCPVGTAGQTNGTRAAIYVTGLEIHKRI